MLVCLQAVDDGDGDGDGNGNGNGIGDGDGDGGRGKAFTSIHYYTTRQQTNIITSRHSLLATRRLVTSVSAMANIYHIISSQ